MVLTRTVAVFSDWAGAAVPVFQAESCGVRLATDQDQSLVFFSKYDSCYARTEVR